MSWIRTYVIICAAILAAVAVALTLLVSLVDLGMSGHGIAAMFLGALLTFALGMVLMGLLFASGRSGHDDSVYEAQIRSEPAVGHHSRDNADSGSS